MRTDLYKEGFMAAHIKLISETPGWWNPQGHTIEVGTSGTLLTGVKADLALSSKGSMDAIIKIRQVYSRDKFALSWWVNHAGGLEMPHTAGLIETNSHELKLMFAFLDGAEKDSLWMLKQYGGAAAAQGKFLRQGRYLNIPGPGTGRDGDANISVFVSDEIMKAVRDLLAVKHYSVG